MAFKEVSDLSADVTVSIGGTNRKTGKKNPTRAEGYYLGLREVADNKKKSGKSFIYFLQTPKGNVGVWGKTDMDRKMGAVPLGAMIFIEFDRMVGTPNGEMYKYRVGVDAENTIEVDTLPAGNSKADGFAASPDEEETAGVMDEDTTDDEDAEQAAALAAAERRAKVQALLGNKSKAK